MSQLFLLAKLPLAQTAGQILFDEGDASCGAHLPFVRQHGTPPDEFCAEIGSDSPRGKTWFTGWIRKIPLDYFTAFWQIPIVNFARPLSTTCAIAGIK